MSWQVIPENLGPALANPNAVAAMMTMVLLKRSHVPLDRDVIFVSEAGEESASGMGIGYLVSDHFAEIEAEACLAEGGGVIRRGGVARFATVQTMEKRRPGTMSKLFSTHPPTDDRIKKSQEEIAGLKPRPEYVVTTSEFSDVKLRLAMLENQRRPDKAA